MNILVSTANKLIIELNKLDLGAYLWHAAVTGSAYIRFEDQRMGSIRVGNHEGRKKLKYKFNLRSDMGLSKGEWRKDGDIWRYYCPLNQWRELIPLMVARNVDCQGWEKKYSYCIPKYKLKQMKKS